MSHLGPGNSFSQHALNLKGNCDVKEQNSFYVTFKCCSSPKGCYCKSVGWDFLLKCNTFGSRNLFWFPDLYTRPRFNQPAPLSFYSFKSRVSPCCKQTPDIQWSSKAPAGSMGVNPSVQQVNSTTVLHDMHFFFLAWNDTQTTSIPFVLGKLPDRESSVTSVSSPLLKGAPPTNYY